MRVFVQTMIVSLHPRCSSRRVVASTSSSRWAGPGGVQAKELEAFLEAGYTQRHPLELGLGLGTYTLFTLANRLTDAPLDQAFAAFCWLKNQAEASAV